MPNYKFRDQPPNNTECENDNPSQKDSSADNHYNNFIDNIINV